jgi:1,4-dihydroxy-2-naphthoyl-CoA hydrolase
MDLPPDAVEMLNAHRGGFEHLIGLTFTAVSLDRVVAEITAGDDHHQPYGLVHGGVYAALIETVCSVGAAMNAMADGRSTVGLDNHSSFLRAARTGRLIATAVPLKKGRTTHVWTAEVHDADDRLCATGQVRLLCMDAGTAVAGETVGLK